VLKARSESRSTMMSWRTWVRTLASPTYKCLRSRIGTFFWLSWTKLSTSTTLWVRRCCSSLGRGLLSRWFYMMAMISCALRRRMWFVCGTFMITGRCRLNCGHLMSFQGRKCNWSSSMRIVTALSSSSWSPINSFTYSRIALSFAPNTNLIPS
jgi:hypothetical protein